MSISQVLGAVARALAAAACWALLQGCAIAGGLHLLGTIALPGTPGRIDHLAYAPDRQLLFIAGLGANTLEVVDVAAGRRIAQVRGMREPQGTAWSTALARAYVANGDAGTVQALEGVTAVATARGLPDADNLRLDDASGRLYVGFGHGIAVLDTRSLAVLRRYELPGHPEAFSLARDRLYVNVPEAGAVIVVDRDSGKTLGTWSVAPAAANYPLALDANGHRLFVATRRPPTIRVLDSVTGQLESQLPICGDADDLFFEPSGQRLYAICGDGHVNVIRVSGSGPYPIEQRVETSQGARTGLLVPELGRLFVAAPARAGREAALLVFAID
ncbi:hypothetical protein JJB11_01435 [Ramlibacter ginsenosidimutans]|uniref:YncE family protein n=1 Tax=Ramlibacter ginsenosidimutans TaxID=502333 RepID=A0A934TNT0_9BURK|nr:hypothetical protein [Ramlibacter ginsenosidimutans]MBK6004739.1 hypothetical protein [Ramlibacter ginsenosidimutans]